MGTNPFKLRSSYPFQWNIEISQIAELSNILQDSLKHGNNILLLESPDSGSLMIGVGLPYGFVEYIHRLGSSPNLIATISSVTENIDSFIKFNLGGTQTPMPIEKCLPIFFVEKIALYFLQYKKLPAYVNWTKA
jgi:hypothetical protein